MNRSDLTFSPIVSTAPGFSVSFDNTSTNFALQSTSLREWAGPASRAVRLTAPAANDFHINFGTSDIVAASSDSILILGGTVEIFTPVKPTYTHIACVSSTSIVLNIVLGTGQ